MIRPAAFGFNEETAVNNYFQSNPAISKEAPIATGIQQRALLEFDNMVQTLRNHDIDVVVIEDTKEPAKPDAIFPNNWLSTSPDGIVTVFPMYAPSRRLEKRDDIIKILADQFIVKDLQDWSEFEVEGRFLEGTGSMVFDHDNKMIYAAVSERTNLSVLEKFAATNGYQAIVFLATDKNGMPVYHTNVAMTLGENFAVLCEEAIDEEWELIAVRQLLESTGHSIIAITREQMHRFAGNMLPVKNKKGEKILVMSKTAFDSLRKEQKQMLEAYAKLLPIAVPTIEEVEGGSVRCMMAEVFLGRK
ncbi:MAG TPA: arginine deiminase-related protein [Chitinophagaceae bacterium]|nr:arginine deiminase-related protein [Chitinophagaceae bacterium]